jgi:hypothetical protein
MISLQKLFKEPRSIIDFYKIAINNPRDFAKNLKLDEYIKLSVYTVLIICSITLITQVLRLSVAELMMSLGIALLSLFFSGVITLLIAKLADAKVNFQECLTLVTYIYILCLPFTFMNSLLLNLPILNQLVGITSLVPSAVYVYFSYLVLSEVRDGKKNTIIWICGVLALIPLLAYLF